MDQPKISADVLLSAMEQAIDPMAVIGIDSRLGMTVVTEGVETEQQWRLLEELHCDVMQGYLFAKPLPPEELEKWFRERQERGSFLIPTKV